MTEFIDTVGMMVPATGAVAVSPSDSVALTTVARGLYVGVTGDVAVYMINPAGNSTSVVFTAVPAGTILPIRVKQVLATGTSASSITALS